MAIPPHLYPVRSNLDDADSSQALKNEQEFFLCCVSFGLLDALRLLEE
jgi:hypothetical protein